MKDAIAEHLRNVDYAVVDCGTVGAASVDYPDFAAAVGLGVVSGQFDRGILVCGTGIGMSMAANKIAGIRAAVVHDEKTAVLAAEHNHANVLCLGGRLLSVPLALGMVELWLTTPFDKRHQGRLDKIAALERRGD